MVGGEEKARVVCQKKRNGRLEAAGMALQALAVSCGCSRAAAQMVFGTDGEEGVGGGAGGGPHLCADDGEVQAWQVVWQEQGGGSAGRGAAVAHPGCSGGATAVRGVALQGRAHSVGASGGWGGTCTACHPAPTTPLRNPQLASCQEQGSPRIAARWPECCYSLPPQSLCCFGRHLPHDCGNEREGVRTQAPFPHPQRPAAFHTYPHPHPHGQELSAPSYNGIPRGAAAAPAGADAVVDPGEVLRGALLALSPQAGVHLACVGGRGDMSDSFWSARRGLTNTLVPLPTIFLGDRKGRAGK